MADIKFSDFPKANQSKDSDEIAVLQDGVNKMIASPVLESKIINKTVTRVIEQGGASLNVVNLKGVVPTYADLALITPTPELNDAYQVEADGLVYVYTDNGFQADGDGFVFQPNVNGVVEEGNVNAVSGGEVYDKTLVIETEDYSIEKQGLLSILDSNFNIALNINEEGKLDAFLSEKTIEKSNINPKETEEYDIENYGLFAIVDKDYNVCFKVLPNGEVLFKPSDTIEFGMSIYNKLKPNNELKYTEIGDSISALDNHISGGYAGDGYGQFFCDILGIKYENHYVNGQSGWSCVDFATWIINTGGGNFPQDHDLYTIFLGTNDWGQGQNIGTMDDYINDTFLLDNKTSYGAYRKIMDRIIGNRGESIPNIILITPMHRGLFGFGGDLNTLVLPDSQEINGNKLDDFSDMVRKIAKYEGVDCLDLFDHGFVPRRFLNMNLTWNTSESDSPENFQDILYDNLHPTTKGHKLIASRLLNKITNITLTY